MTSETDQPEFDLATLDVLLNSFSELASSQQTERKEFYGSMTSQICAATDSNGACVLVRNPQNQIRFVHQHGMEIFLKNNQPALVDLIRKICNVPVEQAQQGIHKLVNQKAVFSRCKTGTGHEFVFSLLRPGSDDTLSDQIHQDLARELVRHIEIFENQQTAKRKSRSAADLAQISKFGQDLGKSISTQELSFHLVNDLAKITRADRVSFFSNKGRIRAISGVANVSHQTEVARNLGKVARLATTTEGIEWHGSELQVDSARPPRGLEALVESLPADSGYVIPVRFENSNRGVLLFEYFDSDQSTSFDRRELINEIVLYAAPIVERNFRSNAIPAFGLQSWLFSRLLVPSIRSVLLVASTLLILAAAGYWLFWLDSAFEIYGEGTLDTVEKRHAFAHVQGEVESIFVSEQAEVEQGTPLLLIRSRDLEKDQATVVGKIEETRTELRTLELSDFRQEQQDDLDDARRASDMKRLKIRLSTLETQQKFYAEKEKQLEICAPMGGVVTTQQIEQKLLDRPIERGDVLMTVSKTQGEWEVRLEIPDARIEYVKQAIAESPDNKPSVKFRLTVDSSETFTGKLERIDFRATRQDETEVAKVVAHVSIDERTLGESLRIGARVYGKIECGRRSNFFLLTYEARNRINQWLFQ